MKKGVRLKFLDCVQSFSKNLDEFEELANNWIKKIEGAGGEIIDVRFQTKAESRSWLMWSVLIIYRPQKEGDEE